MTPDLPNANQTTRPRVQNRLKLETMEDRIVPALATATLVGTTLTVQGDASDNYLEVFQAGTAIVVRDQWVELGRFDVAGVQTLQVNTGDGRNVVKVSSDITILTQLTGGNDRDKISTGSGPSVLTGLDGNDVLKGGLNEDSFDAGGGNRNNVYKVAIVDQIVTNDQTRFIPESVLPPNSNSVGLPQQILLANEVRALLDRASAASASNDAIIAIVDRNGRVLGVRVENGVNPAILNDPALLNFAIDGAVAKARTGAFFGNNEAPLTSRTIQNISQSTITQREVDSIPYDTNPDSTDRGPGFVAAVGIKAHFPAGIAFTPQVDLFAIEHSNRDGSYAPGPDGVRGTADDILLAQRFDLPAAFVPPGQELFAPDSFGVESGLAPRVPGTNIPIAQGRGIATLPGGIPIYKGTRIPNQFGIDLNDDATIIDKQQVGGIGVFFPGATGFATEENSILSSTYNVALPDRSLEAEYIAFAALGGITRTRDFPDSRFFDIGGVALPATMNGLPGGRIDLVGITLDIFGSRGTTNGRDEILRTAGAVGSSVPGGIEQVVDNDANNDGVVGDNLVYRDGLSAPDGFLVTPHDGVGITAAEVESIINLSIIQANTTRAAIRLPIGERAKFVIAVADREGNIVGLFRQQDATIFSIDVAVAKARNANYYADPTRLQPIDQIPGVPAGVAFTARSFRFLAHPRFPIGIDGTPPGPFSQLLDGGADPITALQVGPRLPASAYNSVLGFDAFNPSTNFRDPTNPTRQNGIIFFPGSAPLYRDGQLVGGFGISGDGVDQDDVVTGAGQVNFGVPLSILRVDQIMINGVRVPYQKTNRNPEG